MEFLLLIFIHIWLLIFNTPIVQILDHNLDFEGERTSMSFMSSFWALKGAGGLCMGFGNLILMLDMATGL